MYHIRFFHWKRIEIPLLKSICLLNDFQTPHNLKKSTLTKILQNFYLKMVLKVNCKQFSTIDNNIIIILEDSPGDVWYSIVESNDIIISENGPGGT